MDSKMKGISRTTKAYSHVTTLMVAKRTFNTIQRSIAWLETFLNDVESAIAIIADGKFPSHLCSIEAMTKILTEVTQQLPNEPGS